MIFYLYFTCLLDKLETVLKESSTLFLFICLKKVGPIWPQFTPAHSIVNIDTYAVKLSNRSSCSDVSSWRRGPWTSVNGGVEACRFLNHLFPE